MECLRSVAAELRPEKFGLSSYDGRWAEYFAESRFVRDRRAYLAVRCALFAFMLGVLVWSLVDSAESLQCWPIFLTHQGLLIEVVYLGFAAATTATAAKATVTAAPLPWYGAAAWVLQAVAFPGSCLVFLLYWALDFDGTLRVLSPFTHGANFAVMLVDQILTKQPMRLAHASYFLLYASFYTIWTIVHFAAGFKDCSNNRYIYDALNWKKFDQAATVAAIILLVITPLLTLAFWGCFKSRARGLDEPDENAAKVGHRSPPARGGKNCPH